MLEFLIESMFVFCGSQQTVLLPMDTKSPVLTADLQETCTCAIKRFRFEIVNIEIMQHLFVIKTF
jgi:hypothetical protein